LGDSIRDNSPEGEPDVALSEFNKYCKAHLPGMMLGAEKNKVIENLVFSYAEKVKEQKRPESWRNLKKVGSS